MSFKRSFLNFSKKKIKFKFSCFHIFGQNVVTTFYLPISCFHIFGQNVVITLSFRLHDSKKNIVFTTYLRRRFYDQVSTSKTSCFWSFFPVSVQRKGIFDIVWFTNQEQLLFWRKIQQGCGWSTFSVAGIEIRGYNIYMLQWYFKTIFRSL